MKDGSTGGILAFIVAAPLVVICCGGHVAVLASIVTGAVGTATGLDVLTTLLIAVGTGVAILAIRTFTRGHQASDAKSQETKETS